MPSDSQKYRHRTPGQLAAGSLFFTFSSLATWLRIVIAAHIPPVDSLIGVCVLLVCDGLFIRWALLRLAAQRAEYQRDPTGFVAHRAAVATVAGARGRWLLWILWAVLWSAGVLVAAIALVSIGGNAAETAGGMVVLLLGPLGIIACVVLGMRSFRRGRRMTTGTDILVGHQNSQW